MSTRYAICPFCNKTFKVAEGADTPLCNQHNGISVVMMEAYTTSDKIMVFDFNTQVERPCTKEDLEVIQKCQ